MTPPRLRLYHSMYQLFSATMLVALTTNNMGILWVAMEAATLTTVLLVSVYRTAASLEAAGSTSSCAGSASRWPCWARCCTWRLSGCWGRTAAGCCGPTWPK